MKRITLHIGTEKTATSSLQAFFRLNRQSLREKGIWYPTGNNVDYCCRSGHFPLAAALLRGPVEFIPRTKRFEAKLLYRKLLDDFDERKEDHLLLSAEHFSSRCSSPDSIATLAKLLEGCAQHNQHQRRPRRSYS